MEYLKRKCDLVTSQVLGLFVLGSLVEREAVCSTLVTPFASDGSALSSVSFLSGQVERVEKNYSAP